MFIRDINYGDVLLVNLTKYNRVIGIVQSINDVAKTVTFSKIDTLIDSVKGACFKGILENITLNFSQERFEKFSAYQYFTICRYYDLAPSFVIEDFFKPSDLVYSGYNIIYDGKRWDIIGLVNRAEHFINQEKIFLELLLIYCGKTGEILNIPQYIINFGIRGINFSDNSFRLCSDTTKLNNLEELRDRLLNFEICREYTIHGLIV